MKVGQVTLDILSKLSNLFANKYPKKPALSVNKFYKEVKGDIKAKDPTFLLLARYVAAPVPILLPRTIIFAGITSASFTK